MSSVLKIFTVPSEFIPSSETLLLFSLLKEIPREGIHCYNFEGKWRYDGVIDWCNTHTIITTNIIECSFILLPYKFKGIRDELFNKLNLLSQKFMKPLICFYNDDNDATFKLPTNVHLYRCSFYESTKHINEFSFPAFSPDYYRNKIISDPMCSVGYCGHTMHGRMRYLKSLETDISSDFILRDGFWAPGIDKMTARREYFENLENNIFTFCYRGAGNFSYRFYETLMMGRIPVLVNTDCVFLHKDKISNDVGLIVNEVDITPDQLSEKIKDYYEKNKSKLTEIQIQNRKIWEDYYSPIGFLNYMKKNYTSTII
jgi:hypothetical protein